MNAIKELITAASILLALASCGPGNIYEKAVELPQEGWSYQDTVCFHFAIKDTSAHYDFWLDIDHDATYAFQNVYTQFHTTYPDGTKKDQTLSLELADKNGLWNGTCHGDRCTIHIPLQSNAYFNQSGSYTICLEQYMRESPITGIRKIQLAIAKSPEADESSR